MSKKVDVMYPSACMLGESPVWDNQRASFLWADIEACGIYEYGWKSHKMTHHQLDRRVSLIVPGNNGEMILGVQGGIGKYDLETREFTLLTDLGMAWENHRCNDGACDINGRLWIGTMELSGAKGKGDVYSIDKSAHVVKRMEGISISNGIVWTKDNTRFFHTDSVTREIRTYAYDEMTDNIKYEKTAVVITDKTSLPDGMALDEEGMLWVALWGGFGVGRYDPFTGKMISFIDVPAPNVTSCAFAGEDLDQLVITTARQGLTNEEIKKYPLSGHVFITDQNIKGQACHRCGL